jgi:hypothetical protein
MFWKLSVCFFKERQSTSDNLFMLSCILEKLYDFNLELRLFFIAFGQTYDAINKIYFFEILKEFGIPKKLVNVMKMTLPDSHEKMKIHCQNTEVFGIERGLRPGDALPEHCQYCNGECDEEYRDQVMCCLNTVSIVMENVMRNTETR